MTDANALMTNEFRDYARDRARSFLVHVKSTYLTVTAIRSELAEIDASFDGVHGIDYARDNVSNTADDEGLLRLVERRDSLKAEYEDELMKNLQLQACAHRAMQQVSEPARSALTLHYLEGRTWAEVGVELGYSPDHLRGAIANAGLLELYPHIPRERIPEAWRD